MVSGITSDTSAAAAYMKKTTGLNKDDFMQLFITQLKNQDPLNPTDSSAMVAQMAQLTQVEQAYNTNTNLQNLLSAINSQSNMTAVSYIGKTITAQGSQIQLTSGVASQLGFSLPNVAEQVQVTIADASGKIVRVLNGGTSSAGERNLTWDGLNGNGVQSPSGTYTFAVTGFKSDGSKFDGTPLIKAVVTGVKMDQGSPVLQTGGIDVPLANVTKVGG